MPSFDLLIDSFIAFAGGGFQSGSVFNRYLAATIGDQPGFLEDARSDGDAGAPRPEHMRNEFLGQRKSGFPHSILAHQQPPGHSLIDFMKAVASGNLDRLNR